MSRRARRLRVPGPGGLRIRRGRAGVGAGILLLVAVDCTAVPRSPDGPIPLPAQFHRGMNLQPIGDYGGLLDLEGVPAMLDSLHEIGVSHVAVIPSFFQGQLGDSEFYWEPSRNAVDTQAVEVIGAAHARGMRVLLKPHLWLADRSDGAWRGDIAPAASEWDAWSQAYRTALLGYARLAETHGVDAMSIGSELVGVSGSHPDYWRELVAALRSEFRGALTYAANWDAEFEAVGWWDALDYVGVDAFWPLQETEAEVLTAAVCAARMQEIHARLQVVSRRAGRPLLLTEIGYKSAAGAGFRPWEWHAEQAPDPAVQELIYRCIRDEFGAASTLDLAGLYFWIWYVNPAWGGADNSDFTPRGKPAERVLADWFRARQAGLLPQSSAPPDPSGARR